ncbi:Hypothetical predicted protein [Cloeon dipterum]|uniref:Uncharacterized protein n=1 Tax=Cloeon dipterum TaxID=197152 RepID=A0A8S1E934_9INSE|nr:Hypothetical predicted protein [Cloeon dipterum]
MRLEDVAASAIAKNITYYLNIDDPKWKLMNLSTYMRNVVLKALSSRTIYHPGVSEQELFRILEVLLNRLTLEINLSDGHMYIYRECSEEQVCEILDLISTKATNLKKLEFFTTLVSTQRMVFIFRDDPEIYLSDDITYLKYCFTMYLPGLERIESRNAYHIFRDFSCCRYLNWKEHLELPEQASRLRFLHAHPPKKILTFYLKFPFVTHLTVSPDHRRHYDQNAIESMMHFSHLESLRLIDQLALYIEPFIDHYGAHLRTLIINAMMDGDLNLNHISSKCPQLEVLEIATEVSSFNSEDLFPKLKEFMWSIPYESNNIKLSDILSMPMLESIRIHDIRNSSFNLDDLKGQSADMISNQKVPSQLKIFHMFYIEKDRAKNYFAILKYCPRSQQNSRFSADLLEQRKEGRKYLTFPFFIKTKTK